MLKRILFLTTTLVLLLFAVATIAIRQPALARSAYIAHGRADANRLHRDVVTLTAHRDADFIAGELRKTGAVVTEQVFRARGATYRNVIASFGPETKEVLVVGAHYDAFGGLPGADDNASGTAGLIELARLIGKESLTSSVVLVAYANEEPPFFGSGQMGSAIHAASLEHRRVTGMICLEMIGYFRGDQRWDSWVLGLMYPRRGDFIGVTGGWADRGLARRVKRAMQAARGVDVLRFSGPREILDASDHRNYWARGWTAVMITDTAYLRNPNYHTRRDTAETLDYAKMASVVDGVVNAVVSMPAQNYSAAARSSRIIFPTATAAASRRWPRPRARAPHARQRRWPLVSRPRVLPTRSTVRKRSCGVRIRCALPCRRRGGAPG